MCRGCGSNTQWIDTADRCLRRTWSLWLGSAEFNFLCEIMHTKLNSPIIFNLFRKISILLELILASKQLVRAELSKINYIWIHWFKTNQQRTDCLTSGTVDASPSTVIWYTLLPRLRGSPTPPHFGELLILLGRPQRNVTYISVTPHPVVSVACTPSAKHNSMSKPIRVCPLLWAAFGTNMVAKWFFSPLKLNYQPHETLERDERDGRFFKTAQSVLRWEKRWGNGALLHCK